MKFILLPLCFVIFQNVNSLNLNEIKKMRTETTKPTTTTTPTTTKTTTTPTTTTNTVSTTTTLLVDFSVVDPGPMMVDCPSECASGWLYYDSHCYKKYNTPSTYTQAVSACQSLGAELVSIDSFAENEALRKAYDTNTLVNEADETWIGLKYMSGSWMWSGGSSASYLNWAPSQPASNQCAQMITDPLNNATYQYLRGGWKTYDCSKTSASYICEQPVIDWD
ncbi:hypothetical protein L5515_005923 [Caenorhabditis briggsae]|uniref:C-type lectin domain-containing protein n=3 Tax=Caenorhabditis briggsae TaxID=6238 RepID=A0AAE9JJB7_CAEBR|nr:hypothetical protein L5515_005923 [Caenorhabditis briggsae]